MFPAVMLVAQRLLGRRAVVRRAPGRDRPDAGRRADRVPRLPHADPHGGDDGDVHADDGPARGGLRRPDHPRCSTPTSRVVPPAEPVTALTERGTLDARRRRASPTRARTSRCSRDVSFAARPGQTVAVIGSTGAGKSTLVNLVPRLFDVTGGRVLVGGVDVRDLDPELLVVGARAGAAAGVPVLRHRRHQPAARQARRDRRASCGRRSRSPRPATSSRRMPDGPRRAGRPGRHQRQRRPAPAARDRAGGDPPARDLPVRRLVLRARPGHRRPAAGGAAAGHPRRDGGDRRPAGLHDPRRRPDPRRSRTARSSAAAPTTSCSTTCETYREIVASQLTAEEAA